MSAERELRIKRIELQQAAARFGALKNARRCDAKAFTDANAALEAAARAFVRAEDEVRAIDAMDQRQDGAA